MTFVSYAQNYEDVMLWRALQTVEAGFWIDVGAAHPTEYSVTRAFYDRGWHGVNIEPEPEYAAALCSERQRDINLHVAVAAVPGRATLHRIPGTGLSTFDANIAANHLAAGFPAEQPMEVEVTTLAAICAAHAPDDIHFLKIDVEGFEREVLLGADLKVHRPWIIVVEATLPNSQVSSTETFADLLLAADYRQCWFDGLNVFFLAAEHETRLAPFFRAPPNVFDGFIQVGLVSAVERAEAAERRVVELEATEQRVKTLDASLTEALGAVAAKDHEIAAAELRVTKLVCSLNKAELARSIEVASHMALASVREEELSSLNAELSRLNAELTCLDADLSRLKAELSRLNAELHRLKAELCMLLGSNSWRLTAPLRAVARTLRGDSAP
jgi:FkbM family methyltransferase